jgi:probable F420-dependent oxidoreductase
VLVDLVLRGLPIGQVAARAALVERLGFDSVGVTETAGNPFLAAAQAAQATSRVRVATAIALAFPRSPMDLAYTSWDLQSLSGGRFALGLGSQVRAHVERRYSAPWSHPAPRMRELILALGAIWDAWESGGELAFEGRFYSHTLMPPNFRPQPTGRPRPPVLLAAVRPLMTEVAGEVADGFLGHAFCTAEVLRAITVPALERGLERAGRSRDQLELTAAVFVALSEQEWESSRRRVAFYGSTPGYRHVLDQHGLGRLHEALHRCSLAGEWAAMAELVDDDVLALFAVRGADPGAVAQEVRRRVGGVAGRVGLVTETSDPTALAAVARALQAPCDDRPTVPAPGTVDPPDL